MSPSPVHCRSSRKNPLRLPSPQRYSSELPSRNLRAVTEWIQTLLPVTMLLYTDRVKENNGNTACAWDSRRVNKTPPPVTPLRWTTQHLPSRRHRVPGHSGGPHEPSPATLYNTSDHIPVRKQSECPQSVVRVAVSRQRVHRGKRKGRRDLAPERVQDTSKVNSILPRFHRLI